MTEQEWLESGDPSAMLRWLTTREPSGYDDASGWTYPSDRQLRLFACACCRLQGSDNARVDEYERRSNIIDVQWTDLAWAQSWCSSENGRPGMDKAPTHAVRADLLRCIFGNPWRPVPVCTEQERCCCGTLLDGSHDHNSCGPPFTNPAEPWLTPTVLFIANSIYENRD